jgi:hypothetical protein
MAGIHDGFGREARESGEAELKRRRIGIGSIGATDAIPEKGIARNEDSGFAVVQANRPRAVARRMQHREARAWYEVAFGEKHGRFRKILPEIAEKAGCLDGVEKGFVGLSPGLPR